MPLRYAIPLSSPQGHRKITRKLYTKLKYTQADDVPIPNSTILEIKFYLKRSRACCTIFVENDLALSHYLPTISLENIPCFIASQLQAQKIADRHRKSVQLFTVLVVLSQYFVADPIETTSTPTLFFWCDPGRRRTFYLFAYLSHPMEARTYSAAELLGLRPGRVAETPSEVLAKLKADPEFNEVVSKDKGNLAQTQNRAPKKLKGVSSSSNESDEIVYRGKNIPRQPSQLIHPSSNTQWKYRGRTGSEVGSSDPLSAPTGLDKQSSEGFQRFFKAVVSPTHVRVTAGGRIVPNTRNSVSPTTKWDQERAPVDVQNSVEPVKETKAGPIFAPLNSHLPAPMLAQPYQTQPVIYQQMGVQIPFYHHMQGHLPQGFAFPYSFAPVAAPVSSNPYFPLPENEQRTQMLGSGDGRHNGGENDNKPRRAPIMISPPEQFDQNRPFYVNGQLVLPPAGMSSGPGQMPHLSTGHYFPHAVVPAVPQHDPRMAAVNHPGPSMPITVGQNMPHQHYPVTRDRNPAPQQAQPAQQSQKQQQAQSSQQSSVPAAPPSGAMPPLSSIRPSEITRKQLEGLRTSLKYYIGQLQFNRHQIDEPWVFAQAQRVRDDIKQFEHNLRMQIQFETENYPTMEPTPRHISEMVIPCSTPSRPPSIRHTHASGSSHNGSVRSGQGSGPRHFQHQQGGTSSRGCPKPNRAAVGINSNKTDNSTAHIDALEAAVIQRLSAPDATSEQKAMLEAITRPLNPSYDPQSLLAAQQSASDNGSLKGPSAQPSQPKDERLVQAQAQLSTMTLQDLQKERDGIQSGSVYLTNGNASYLPPANGNGVPVPYLVGNYPPGTDPWTYRGHEFVYARELSAAEKQARNVYWGKLPSKGAILPKFDGKDFYPASPQKALENMGNNRNGISGRPDVDFGLEPTRSGTDPFRSSRDTSSIRSYESGRKLSKAIPIVAPPGMEKKGSMDGPNSSKAKDNDGADTASSLDESTAKYLEKKSPSLSRRAVERSRHVNTTCCGISCSRSELTVQSIKSGHDLWQNMLKKGSTSGNALPGAVSPTTATGYLPQYSGNAIASLGPTISNSSPARVPFPNADDKLIELEEPRSATDKIGENCPPSSAPSVEHDITKDLHQRMLRDAERRGVIGSDWQ